MTRDQDATDNAHDVLDAAFRLSGESLPLDHGYALFGAISKVIPSLHTGEPEATLGIHPVYGQRLSPGVLGLISRSWLKLRLSAGALPSVLPLVGQELDVAGHRVRVGVPTLHPLVPAASLKARFVTIKKFHEEVGPFREALLRQLATLGFAAKVETDLEVGPRRVLRVADHTIVGFPVALHGLSATVSLAIQRSGVGGRRHMGAGIFVPFGKGA